MLKLTFHGHSFWEVGDGECTVLIDPFISGNPLADVSPAAFAKARAVIITHGHGDHIGDAETIAKQADALIISNYEIVNYMSARGCKGHPLHIGGGHNFDFGHVKLTIAHHGSTGPNGEALGNPAGVVLSMGGRKVYHAGDTGLFLDMQLIAEMNGPLDVALLPIGDNFTMGIKDAVKAAEFLKAAMTIPMHYGTFGLIESDPGDFVLKVKSKGLPALALAVGQSYTV